MNQAQLVLEAMCLMLILGAALVRNTLNGTHCMETLVSTNPQVSLGVTSLHDRQLSQDKATQRCTWLNVGEASCQYDMRCAASGSRRQEGPRRGMAILGQGSPSSLCTT